MGSFIRTNGEWVSTDFILRSDGAWTTSSYNGFAYDGTGWVQFMPTGGTLYAPINFAAEVDSNSVSLTWDDPGTGTTPTNVQVRIAELSPVYTELVYGVNGVTYDALNPSTTYQAQVQYVVRSTEDGTITETSAVTTVFFTTSVLFGPSVPAADPGGSGSDSTFTFSDPAGTPGAVDSGDCWWEYIVQIPSDPVEFLLVWEDTAVTAEVAGDIGDVDIDFVAEGLECGELARFKYREVCDGVAGDWDYSQAWVIVCDWAADCGGSATNSSLSVAPFTDAVSFLPRICMGDDGPRVEDDVTDVVFSRDPYYFGSGQDAGDWYVSSKSDSPTYGGAITSGTNTSVGAISGDLSVSLAVYLRDIPPTALEGGLLLARWGNRVTLRAYADGSGFSVGFVFPDADGGAFSIQSVTEQPLDQFVTVGFTLDADGTKTLYLDGVADATDTDTTLPDFDDFDSSIALYGGNQTLIKRAAVWTRVLTAEEMTLAHNVDSTVYATVTWTYAQQASEASGFRADEPAPLTYAPANSGTIAIEALGGTSLGGDLAGLVNANRADLGEDPLYFYAGLTTDEDYPTAGYPGGGVGKSGTAFTQAGGGPGFSGIIANTAWEDTPLTTDPILIAGASGGDPNGSGASATGLDGGGFAATADAEDPNTGGSSGRGGSTIGGNGGILTGGNSGSFLQGGNSNGDADAAGGGGGYYGGAGGIAATKGGGGGSSYVDGSCTDEVFAQGPSTGTLGYVEVTGDFALPAVSTVQIDAGADAVWPMWDMMGRECLDVSGNGHHMATVTDVYASQRRVDFVGPDGVRYFRNPNYATVTQTSREYVYKSTAAPGIPDNTPAHTGFMWEVFVCRPLEAGDRPSSATGMAGFNDSTASSNVAEVRMGTSQGSDIINFCGVSATGLSLFNTAGLWHHVVGRLESDNSVTIYVDGTSVGTGTWASTTTSHGWANGGTGPTSNIGSCKQGVACNMAVYDTDAYTAQHVIDAMTAFGIGEELNALETEILAQDTNLLYYYKFDEPDDPPTTDYANQGSGPKTLGNINGTDVGQGLLGPDRQSYALWDDDGSGTCDFQPADSADDDAISHNTNDVTIAMMIKFRGIGALKYFVGKNGTVASEREYVAGCDVSGRFFLHDMNTGGTAYRLTQTVTDALVADTWYHMVLKYYNSDTHPDIYLNGVLANEDELAASGIKQTATSSATMQVGRYRESFASDNAGIQVTHLAIWNTSKTAGDILTMAEAAETDGWIQT